MEGRYGDFEKQGIFLAGKQYTDAEFEKDGSVSSLSIFISNSKGNVTATMYEWNIYKSVSFVGQKLSKAKKISITDELQDMANKLVDETVVKDKPKFALIPLTTDYGNTLVDNYVTDALTEAMFNTRKITIVERSNLQAILKEQKFQASGLVNEKTAKAIGMLAGADFVCFGTLKDLGNSITLNAKVVDVETGELCAISRATIIKDDYLKNQVQSAVSSEQAKTEVNTKKTSTSVSQKTTSADNAWKVTSYEDSFGGGKYYVFSINSTDSRMLFIQYKKSYNPANSRVIAGIHWTEKDNWDNNNKGTYDIKGKNGTVVTKYLSEIWKCFLNTSESNYFLYAWNPKDGSRWLVDMMVKSDSVAVRRDGLNRRFQTAGLLDKMAEYGITWKEIDAAMANEEF